MSRALPPRRTPAHASNQLRRNNVKPLLSTVGGKPVERHIDRQPTPEDINASPKSTDTEEEEEEAARACLPARPDSAQQLSNVSNKRKIASGRAQSTRAKKARASSPQLDEQEDSGPLFGGFLSSSQPVKRRYYSSQGVENMHVSPPNPTEAKSGASQPQKSKGRGFKAPTTMAEQAKRPPSTTFKLPPSLAESPRSSVTNTFRTPRSSPPPGDNVPPSSQLLSDSDSESPLSSPPGTPELEIIERGMSTMVNGKVMLPCPLCRTLVPQEILESFNSGQVLRWKDKMAFCQEHKKNDAKNEGAVRQYPTIEWASFTSRLKRFHSVIEGILDRRRESFYRNILDEHVASGKGRNAFRTVDDEGQANAAPGYYGMKGARLMQEHILANFATKIRRLASTDKAIPRTGPAGYVQTVLAPEMAVLLVMEDFPGIDEDKARAILAESVEVGKLVDDADDEEPSQPKSFDPLNGGDDGPEAGDSD